MESCVQTQTVSWSWTTPGWVHKENWWENPLPASWPLDQAFKTMTQCKWIANDGIKTFLGNPCGRDAGISVIPQVSCMQVVGYLLLIEEGFWIKRRKLGGNNTERVRDTYLTVCLAQSSLSVLLALVCCRLVSSHTVPLKGWTRWNSLQCTQSFQGCSSSSALDWQSDKTQTRCGHWVELLVDFGGFSPPQKAMTY